MENLSFLTEDACFTSTVSHKPSFLIKMLRKELKIQNATYKKLGFVASENGTVCCSGPGQALNEDEQSVIWSSGKYQNSL